MTRVRMPFQGLQEFPVLFVPRTSKLFLNHVLFLQTERFHHQAKRISETVTSGWDAVELWIKVFSIHFLRTTPKCRVLSLSGGLRPFTTKLKPFVNWIPKVSKNMYSLWPSNSVISTASELDSLRYGIPVVSKNRNQTCLTVHWGILHSTSSSLLSLVDFMWGSSALFFETKQCGVGLPFLGRQRFDSNPYPVIHRRGRPLSSSLREVRVRPLYFGNFCLHFDTGST